METASVYRVEVLYCWRPNDGIESLYNFLQSISLQIGIKVNLQLLIKGADTETLAKIKSIIDSLETKDFMIIHMEKKENRNYDLGTYRSQIVKSKTKVFVLMSATSIFTSRYSLIKLATPVLTGQTLICGSMVSEESISSNLYSVVRNGIKKRIGETQSNYLIFFGTMFYFTSFFPVLISKRIIFPKFPNRHIRSTGMAIEREFAINTFKKTYRAKLSVHATESGRNGITKSAYKYGFTPLVALESGVVDLGDSRVKKTFRNNKTSIPLVTDKVYREFYFYDNAKQAQLIARTWS